MIAASTRPRLTLAGDTPETARLARDLLAAGLGPLGIYARTRGAAADTAVGRPDRISALASPGDLRDAHLIIIWGQSAMASLLPEAAPGAAVIFAGPGSLEAAGGFVASTRTAPRKVLATGGLARQILLESAVARRARVSRSQVTAMVLGGESGGWIPVRRHLRVAGVPADSILDSRSLDEVVRSCDDAGDLSLERRAAVLMAGAILRGRRRVLCCGSHLPEGIGLTEGFRTFPSVLGTGGLVGHLPVVLTLEERAYLNRTRAGQSLPI